MVARGRVRNGVIVLDEGFWFPGGREVTVLESPAVVPGQQETVQVSEERRQALLGLIGAWKVDNTPDDEEVERIIEEARMEKYGWCGSGGWRRRA
jgi:hypothetical protein